MPDTSSGGIGHAENEFWKLAAASVIGPMHRRHDLRCDDTFAFALIDHWAIAVVCDGAGSARNGAEGAKIVSNAIVENLKLATSKKANRSSIRNIVISAIAKARDELIDCAAHAETDLADYHTTVVGAICRRKRGIFFHIGDGAATCFDYRDGSNNSWKPKGFSSPTKGEFAEVTVFVTDNRWRDYLRFSPVRSTDAISLMTDGVTPFALSAGEIGPDSQFFDGVHDFLDSNSAEDGARSIFKLLDSPPSRKASFDDKTLVWLSTRPRHD